ncbi:mechanosensitive ion channel family protein [Simiduia agarivorans]|uniref:Mechanosensitive ion channel MscS n=1 Tax=Simiduia agarivorans (strain DSM 21679 / JCM 13881 / BCRC 17597 / SA1) TaxID=1117647 RepID=K4KJX1_SIMAS|nr:mechanosensitive ion channel domain-containing protein [Simiduia agarivorans]AFU99291.1 mechanosensitive ion channel MscS [Simiduia agarivorans SA1 = DSM 21679]
MLDFLNITLFEFDDYRLSLLALLNIIAILVAGWIVSRLAQRSLTRLAGSNKRIDQRAAYSIGRILHYIIITIALLMSLSVAGFNFTKLAIVAGALSVGIGFGLQGIANNFISGVIMLFERNINVGDVVELQSGTFGTIKEINVRSTLINTPDNMDVLVPNSEFLSAQVTNWTLREGLVRFRIPFGVAYGTDKDAMRDAVLKAANQVATTVNIEPRYPTRVFMTGFGDSSLDFVLVVWVTHEAAQAPTRTKSAYFWAVDTALREGGFEIPFPQRDLHLRTGFDQRNAEAGGPDAQAGE